MNKKNEYRVWWVPQVGKSNAFYIPVETPEQGKQIINILSAYDCFQYNQRVKSDYCNTGGLEIWDEEYGWVDWYYEDDDGVFDLNEFIDNKSEQSKFIKAQKDILFNQVIFN